MLGGALLTGILWCLTLDTSFANANSNEYWMENLPIALQRVPLNFIAIPGSHDSGTYNITEDSPISEDASIMVYLLGKVFGKLMTKVMCKWGRTQSLTITEQLILGIRYFDLRVAPYSPDPSQYYLVHQQFAIPVVQVLKEVKAFLQTHTREVVLLDLNHFYNMDEAHHVRLISIILDSVGTMLAPQPRGFGSLPSLQNLWVLNRRIIVFYNKPFFYYPPLWMGTRCPSLWPQSLHASEMIWQINSEKPTFRSSFLQFWVVQGVMTPSIATIIFHGLQTLDYMAISASQAFVQWIEEQKLIGLHLDNVNICIADFVERYNFVEAVLRVNNRTS